MKGAEEALGLELGAIIFLQNKQGTGWDGILKYFQRGLLTGREKQVRKGYSARIHLAL